MRRASLTRPELRRLRFRLVRRALGVIVLILVVLAGTVLLFPGPLFRWLVVPRLEEAASRFLGFPLRVAEADLDLGGKLSLAGIEAWGPAPRTGIHGISIARAEIVFSLSRLLAGGTDWIEEVRVESPEVVLDLRHEPFLPPGGAVAPPGGPVLPPGGPVAPGEGRAAPALPRIAIAGADLRIHDGRETLWLHGLDASLDGRRASLHVEVGGGDWTPPRIEAIDFPLQARALLAEGPDPFREILVESLAFGGKEIAWGVKVDLSAPGEVRLSGQLPGWGAACAVGEIAADVLDLRVTVEEAPISEIVAAFTPWRSPDGRGTGELRLILPLAKEEDWRAEADMEIDGVAWHEAGLAASRLVVQGKRGDDFVLACEVLGLDVRLDGFPAVDAVARFRRAPSGAGSEISVDEITLHHGGLAATAAGRVREEDLLIEDAHLSVAPAPLGELGGLVPEATGLDGAFEADAFFEGFAERPETYEANAVARAEGVRGLAGDRSIEAAIAARLAACGVQVEEARVRAGASEASFALAAAAEIPLRAAFTKLEGTIEGTPFEAAVPPVVEVDLAGYRIGPTVLSLLGGGVAFAVEGELGGRTDAWAAARSIGLGAILDPLDLAGDPDGVVSADVSLRLPGGTGDELELEARARITDLGWTVGERRITGAGASIRARGDAGRLILDEARVERGADRVILSASVPVEWGGPTPALLAGERLSASFEAQVAEIADLPISFRDFRDVGGRVAVEGTASTSLAAGLDGALRAARVEAEVLLTGGTLKLYGDAPPLTGVVADISLAGRDVVVRSLTGSTRGSDFRIVGKAVVRPPWEKGGAGIEEVDFRLRSEGALLVRTPHVRVRGDLDVNWKGPWGGAVLGGELKISRAYYTQDIALLPGRGASLPLQLFSIKEPPFADLRFALHVRGDRSIVIRNNLLSTHATADLLLGGTGREPAVSGTLSAREGAVNFGNARLTLRSGLVEFLETDPLNPRLNIVLGDTIRSYSVTVSVSGTMEEPEVLLDSSPPLERERVLVLIATGLTFDEIEERGVDRVAAVQAAVYMGRRIARYFSTGDPTEASFFDRLSIYAESSRSSRYEDPLRVEFRAFENLLFDKDEVFLQGERDAYGDYNFNAGFRFELD